MTIAMTIITISIGVTTIVPSTASSADVSPNFQPESAIAFWRASSGWVSDHTINRLANSNWEQAPSGIRPASFQRDNLHIPGSSKNLHRNRFRVPPHGEVDRCLPHPQVADPYLRQCLRQCRVI